MSVFTAESNAWNTAFANGFDERPVQSRRSSLSSTSTSGFSDHSELSEASTNTTTSSGRYSESISDNDEHVFVVRDEQQRWRPLDLAADAGNFLDLSLPASPYISASTSQVANSLDSLAHSQSLCLEHPLSHSQLVSEHVSGEQDPLSQSESSLAQSCLDNTKASVRPNPRRTSASRSWSKPTLVRQVARRQDFVMYLVGESIPPSMSIVAAANNVSPRSESATQLVSHIWPITGALGSNNQMISLRFYIKEILRRSHSTYSILQLTLYYLHIVKSKGKVPVCSSSTNTDNPLLCGRRMFLAALILASKYLQDRNYSAKAWSKLTNLPVKDINTNERAFLKAIDYRLHVEVETYNEWCAKVSECVDATVLGQTCPWDKVFGSSADSIDSIMNTPDSIMAALKDAPAVGATTYSSSMPQLCPGSKVMAPHHASPARPATFPLTPAETVRTTSVEAEYAPVVIDLTQSPQIIDLTSSPASFTSADEISMTYSEHGRSISPPAYLQATHLPTPPSSQPSIMSSTDEFPMDSPMLVDAQPARRQHTLVDVLANRVAALTHQHGLSPPWSNSSRASSQDLTAPQQSATEQDVPDKLPAIAALLCRGLKAHLKPVVSEKDQSPRQCGKKRSCCHLDEDRALKAPKYDMVAECLKTASTW